MAQHLDGSFMDRDTRTIGQVFTVTNPFQLAVFRNWAAEAGLPDQPVLEPFAGANCLIRHLESLNLCRDYTAYDIKPAADDVVARDTLADFPTTYSVCVTNPPWLAKNSATARRLKYPVCDFDDIYKFSLSRCLDHCEYVAALVPEAFIRSGLFQDRLTDFISIRSRLFLHTHDPTGLALFGPRPKPDIRLWSDDQFIGFYHQLKARYLPQNAPAEIDVRFNALDGSLGLIAFDNVHEASIRFCHIDEISDYEIKHSSRFITRIWAENSPSIDQLNLYLGQLRDDTHDVFLSSYRGLRKDGFYRRRLDWNLARRIICHV